jgi:hypothetical protein
MPNLLTFFSLTEPCDYKCFMKKLDSYQLMLEQSNLLNKTVKLKVKTLFKSMVLKLECKSIMIKKYQTKEEKRANKKLNKHKKLLVITSGLNGLKDSSCLFAIDGFVRALFRGSLSPTSLLDTHDVVIIPILNPEGSHLGLGVFDTMQ